VMHGNGAWHIAGALIAAGKQAVIEFPKGALGVWVQALAK
jgi:hypothetical protein